MKYTPYKPAEPTLPEGSPNYGLGFTTLDNEAEVPELNVQGRIPQWLSGILLRTGPAKFEVGTQKYNHWFDGLGMLHKFEIHDGGQPLYPLLLAAE